MRITRYFIDSPHVPEHNEEGYVRAEFRSIKIDIVHPANLSAYVREIDARARAAGQFVNLIHVDDATYSSQRDTIIRISCGTICWN